MAADPAGTTPPPPARGTSRRAGQALTGRWAAVLADYRAALDRQPLSEHARRGYAGRVAGFLEWLATGPDLGAEADPLRDPHGRDWAVRDYRTHLKTVRKAKPTTVNATLTALDNFFDHLGLGRPVARRERLAETAPEALDETEQRRFLRAAARAGSARNTAIGLLPLYTGLRVEELERLDVADVPMSARRGKVIVRAGKGPDGGTYREVPLTHAARAALRPWFHERPTRRGAGDTPALFLNRLGTRLGARSIRYIVAELGQAAGLVHDHGPTAGRSRVHPHTLRHTFATQLLRTGTDIVTVADLMGHATLDTTRGYTRSTEADRAKAVDDAFTTDE